DAGDRREHERAGIDDEPVWAGLRCIAQVEPRPLGVGTRDPLARADAGRARTAGLERRPAAELTDPGDLPAVQDLGPPPRLETPAGRDAREVVRVVDRRDVCAVPVG